MADPRVHRYANNASCRLGEDLTAGETSIQLETGKGALFPNPGVDEIFIFTIEHLITGAREICYCTSRSGDILDVERGQEGTDAVDWTSDNNVIVQQRLTAGTLEHLEEGGSIGFDLTDPQEGDTLVFNGTDWVNEPQPCEFQLACSNLTTDITAGTKRGYFRAPYAFRITGVRASLLVAAESGTFTVDINVSDATILSTKLTIDAEEKTSTTAATAAVISSADVGDDEEITIDVDDAGAGARGLVVTILGVRLFGGE